MNYIGKFISNFKDFYKDINTATLTGAIDVIVVKQEDGDFISSPFHVRFGKMGVLRSKEKVVDIEINGEPVDIHMKLGETGEAFFVEKVDDGEEISDYLGTSPLQSTCDLPKQLSFESSDVVRLYPTSPNLRQDPSLVCAKNLKNTSSSPVIPIPNTNNKYGHGRSKSVSDAINSGRDDSKKDTTEGQKSSRSRRKKRRKIAQKVSPLKDSDGQSSENSTTSEVHEANSELKQHIKEIFYLEDLNDDIDTQLSQQSSSMPQLYENSVETKPFDGVMNIPYTDLHTFSDTDLSPHHSNNPSRCNTPVKSDTEYEIERHKTAMKKEASSKDQDTKWSWSWGELPTPPSRSASYSDNLGGQHTKLSLQNLDNSVPSKSVCNEAEKGSMFGNMLNFMSKKKHSRHDPESDGVYLEDLNKEDVDPEIAALYFYQDTDRYSGFKPVQKNEDVESGNGASLPQSPQFNEASSCTKTQPSDSDFDENLRPPYFDLKAFSDVAFSVCGKLNDCIDDEFPESIFLQNLVTYDNFCENVDIFDNPDLVVRMNGKYYNWSTAGPEIMSAILFRRQLPPKVFEELAFKNMPPKEMRKRAESKGYSWFSWRRNQSEVDSDKTNKDATKLQVDNDEIYVPSSSAPNIMYNKEYPLASQSSPELCSHSDGYVSSHVENSTAKANNFEFSQKIKYKKTLRLSPDEINKLNLKYGINEVVFSVTTAYQGTTKCKCNIFLWNYDEKIVISDIDGTITKSDVLGHILPIVGSDWAQCGVAQLFTKIKNNGYNFLYLSARAIGQARLTRDYLKSVKQGDLSLPDGPLLLNPTSLIMALHREVIEKKPEEFKISCLKDIQALFKGQNPFYAGYGNKINDVWAYCAVGIPISRVFTINYKGELKHELTQAFQTTYTSLSDIANLMFPSSSEIQVNGDYSSINYWKIPLPDVAGDIESVFQNK